MLDKLMDPPWLFAGVLWFQVGADYLPKPLGSTLSLLAMWAYICLVVYHVWRRRTGGFDDR